MRLAASGGDSLATTTDAPCVQSLIAALDVAVDLQPIAARCAAVKQVLESTLTDPAVALPAELLKPCADRYARRLLHRDPLGRYTVVAMVWNAGQGTPLHDHASMWCVECVYRGRIRVVSYSHLGTEGGRHRFSRETEVFAGVGEAGALIPPFEYHTIENAEASPSVTLHVYGGDMVWCHAFVADGDAYRQEVRRLCYTEDGAA